MTPGHRGVAGLSLCPRIWGGPALFLVPILLTLQEFVQGHTRSPQWGQQLFSGIAPAHPGAGVGRHPAAPCEPRASLEPSWSQGPWVTKEEKLPESVPGGYCLVATAKGFQAELAFPYAVCHTRRAAGLWEAPWAVGGGLAGEPGCPRAQGRC